MLHRWTQDGQEWACAVYDHGPFCRLCHRVEGDTEHAMLDAVEAGDLLLRVSADGSFMYALSDQGETRVRDLIQGDADSFAIYMQAYLDAGDPEKETR